MKPSRLRLSFAAGLARPRRTARSILGRGFAPTLPRRALHGGAEVGRAALWLAAHERVSEAAAVAADGEQLSRRGADHEPRRDREMELIEPEARVRHPDRVIGVVGPADHGLAGPRFLDRGDHAQLSDRP